MDIRRLFGKRTAGLFYGELLSNIFRGRGAMGANALHHLRHYLHLYFSSRDHTFRSTNL